MPAILLTPPADEVLSLDDAKTHLRVDVADEDALILVLIAAAREWAEEYCERAFVTQTWRATWPTFPRSPGPVDLRLTRAPVTSVTSLTYVDEAGAIITLAPAAYTLNAAGLPPVISPAYDTSWPTTRDLGARGAAVIAEYVAGYGSPVAVPRAIAAAMLLVIGDLYANREAQIVGTITTENPTAKLLLAPYLIPEVA